MKTTLAAILSIAEPHGHEEGTRRLHNETIEECLSASEGFPFEAEFLAPTALRFEPFEEIEYPEADDLANFELSHLPYSRILARADFEIDTDAMFARYSAFNGADAHLWARFVAAQEMGRALSDLVLAANVARPGSLEIAGGIYRFDGPFERRSFRAATNMLGFAVDEVATLGWPVIRSLSVEDVWRWCQAIPGFREGCPTTRGGRALAAFSYQIKGSVAENSPIDLVWALVGLEALYGKGKEGLRAQLIEKSQALLGRPTAFRKRFDGMYDFRSRFVHGDLDLPLSHCLYSATDPSGFEYNSNQTLSVAVAVLLASLQELVVRDWLEPKFTYEVSGLPAGTTERQ